MSKQKLIIVESPAKCNKIEKILGKGYKVIASYGHFTKLDDLAQINFDTFEIDYKVENKKNLKKKKRNAQQKTSVNHEEILDVIKKTNHIKKNKIFYFLY